MHITTIIIYSTIVLEMIFVNLFLVDVYSIRKYSRFVTYTSHIILTIILIAGCMILMSKSPSFGNGNGLFILFGTIYLIPIKLLYKPPFKKSLIILYTSWVYTALAFTIGVQIARLFSPSYLAIIVLIVQTLIYVVTLYIFSKVLKNLYTNILKYISEKISIKYLCTAFLMYITLIAINYAFINNSKIAAVISFILLGITCTFCFYFVFSMILIKRDNEELGKLTYYDTITDCRNRNGLLLAFDEYLKKGDMFCIAFIDLDQFKKINDIYGHNDGDEYLYNFSVLIKKHFSNKIDFFRLHGDEFIILTYMNSNELNNRLHDYEIKFTHSFPKHRFLGFSVGIIEVTDMNLTLDEALSKADMKLYEDKNTKTHYKKNK